MSETPSHNPEHANTAVTAGEFVSWHERMADELDLEAMRLQMQAADNPAIVDDQEYKLAVERLTAQQELLARVGEDFSEHTLRKVGEFLIKKVFEAEE